MSDYEVLQDMIDVLPDTISNLDSGIANLTASIDGLTDEQNAVEWSMSLMTTAASAWMNVKRDEFHPTYNVETSGAWSIANLTEWAIVSGDGTGDSRVIYTDVDVTSGAPSATTTQQYNRQTGFSAAYNHIHKTANLTGTYGILAKRSSLTTGKTLQETNRTKYRQVLKVYDRVLREK